MRFTGDNPSEKANQFSNMSNEDDVDLSDVRILEKKRNIIHPYLQNNIKQKNLQMSES